MATYEDVGSGSTGTLFGGSARDAAAQLFAHPCLVGVLVGGARCIWVDAELVDDEFLNEIPAAVLAALAAGETNEKEHEHELRLA